MMTVEDDALERGGSQRGMKTDDADDNQDDHQAHRGAEQPSAHCRIGQVRKGTRNEEDINAKSYPLRPMVLQRRGHC